MKRCVQGEEWNKCNNDCIDNAIAKIDILIDESNNYVQKQISAI